ncbi:MAG: tRNA (adenosine(37)-N6)-threonylcarbamoyltransferase complex ATPase subunit type 1 TsaE [Proteobacteria bacterium]|nr:tRNA (adenosine(37)-N6)-threonylcarbamoyltransferase complex ATPase subunit type 1 TsaE [Pseudomonadota bacterium]MBU4420700.1 tRNA (adenosine(37)-N6)-threonylcarbamoyltransferase complex ATPase subunit type 1 TsaE [Pseudomonadota bacterium]
MLKIITNSPDETRALGEKTGKNLDLGTVLALTGDLGSGKTIFVQGLAKGLDIPDDYYITSPTYTLINEYPGRYHLFHVDLYRIGNYTDLDDIGLYEILSGDGVVAIEWADKLPKNLLAEYLAVHIDILNDKSRKISIAAYGLIGENLIKKLK